MNYGSGAQDADGNYNFDCYKCYDQSKVGSAINANYEQSWMCQHWYYPTDTTTWSWKYITDNAI